MGFGSVIHACSLFTESGATKSLVAPWHCAQCAAEQRRFFQLAISATTADTDSWMHDSVGMQLVSSQCYVVGVALLLLTYCLPELRGYVRIRHPGIYYYYYIQYTYPKTNLVFYWVNRPIVLNSSCIVVKIRFLIDGIYVQILS